MATRSYLRHEAVVKRNEKLLDLLDKAISRGDTRKIKDLTQAIKNIFDAVNSGLQLRGDA